MQFRTQIPISKSDRPIGYDSKVVSLGSCFAVHMAQKFDSFQFWNSVNPFGILFHPHAIGKLLHLAETQKQFTDTDVFFHNERWHCFDAHSDLSDSDQGNLMQKLNDSVLQTNLQIRQATHIIITYGTAWVYRENASNATVANCHKVPQAHFSNEILSVEAIRESIADTIQIIKRLNPHAQIIFTISPVRHLKDGFVENQRSKSNLISALHDVLQSDDFNLQSSYFPSYEIVMDELRDYRFYDRDMIHPTQMAIDYIWERFSQTHISETALPIMEKVGQIRKNLAHRPFNPDSESHRYFLDKLRESILAVQKQYPHMHF
jgi:hypothetical protein